MLHSRSDKKIERKEADENTSYMAILKQNECACYKINSLIGTYYC